MSLEIRFLHLKAPLFLAGTNYGDKLPGNKGKLSMQGDKWADLGGEFAIKITNDKGVYTYMPFANVITCEPKQETVNVRIVANQHPDHRIAPIKAQIGGPGDVMNQVANTSANVTINAQVESPHQKVQGKPGRKPKYQGEETQGE